MRGIARFAALAATGFLLAGCVGLDDDDGGYGGRTVYNDYPTTVYRGYPRTVYRDYPDYRYDNDRRRYRDYDDDDDDDDRYVGAPWRRQEPRERRFTRKSDDTVCDRRTSICYQNGEIDKTETKERFGNRAADRADDIRDRQRSANVYVPRRDTVCNDDRNRCYQDGRGNVRQTREYFGNRAANNLRRNQERREDRRESRRENRRDNNNS